MWWLDLSSNRLTGTLPAELAQLAHSLEALNVAQNQLQGGVPPALRHLADVRRSSGASGACGGWT